MKIEQVAAQLYTTRDFQKTAVEFAASMKKIRAMGYTAVQVSGVGPIAPGEIKTILDGEGLVCCATHEGPDTILNKPAEVVDKLNTLSCGFTAYPHPTGFDFSKAHDVKALANRLNAAGKVLFDAGKVLTYHNHQIEFRHVDGVPALEMIYNLSDSRYLQGEIDTYWVQYGGASPVEWCAKLKGRLPLLHLKEYGVNGDNQAVMTEIGNGNINWTEVIRAADTAGCLWFIVEQDTGWVNNDPFEALKRSFDYIHGHLCS